MAQDTRSVSTSLHLENSEASQSQIDDQSLESATSEPKCTTIAATSTSHNACLTPESPATFDLSSTLSENLVTTAVNTSNTPRPIVIISGPPSLVMQSQKCLQPRININSDLPSPASVIAGQPQTLFLQALSKLNESSLSMAVMNHFKTIQPNTSAQAYCRQSVEISPPDSLASAPPSYSFVLRQMAVRRRPRIVGTFIPSPSFVQHTPPPNYAAAFDIYVDNPLPPPPARAYNFGFASMPVVCPECGYTGMSMVTSKITICTHLCAVVLCIMCCWVCAPLPYVLRSCKDVYHYCRNCRRFLGMYCPTNPENGLSTS